MRKTLAVLGIIGILLGTSLTASAHNVTLDYYQYNLKCYGNNNRTNMLVRGSTILQEGSHLSICIDVDYCSIRIVAVVAGDESDYLYTSGSK